MRRVLIGFSLGVSSLSAQAGYGLSALTAEQQGLFEAAKKDFAEHHPAAALEKMKQLHQLVPDNQTVTDGLAETAVSVGDDAFAVALLKPWRAAHPDDWFALEWLTRAAAETNDAAERDRDIATLRKLHETTTDERFRRSDRFLVERVKLSTGNLDIYSAYIPFSRYHIYMLGRQTDPEGTLVQQITLESNDIDQVGFAKDHPDQAASGVRRFSMDTYSAGKAAADGKVTQTQALIGFIDGQPTYDEVKARMLKVAGGTNQPLSTRSGIPVTKSH